MVCSATVLKNLNFSKTVVEHPVADPGPLMLGVLDRWTPTVNILQTQIAQISFHIELCPIEARSLLAYIPLPSGFGDFFSIYFV